MNILIGQLYKILKYCNVFSDIIFSRIPRNNFGTIDIIAKNSFYDLLVVCSCIFGNTLGNLKLVSKSVFVFGMRRRKKLSKSIRFCLLNRSFHL